MLEFDTPTHQSIRKKIMWKQTNQFYTYITLTNKETLLTEEYHVSGDITAPVFTIYKF